MATSLRWRRFLLCLLGSVLIVPPVVWVSFVEWGRFPYLYWLILPGVYVAEIAFKWFRISGGNAGPAPWLWVAASNTLVWTILVFALISVVVGMRRGRAPGTTRGRE